MRSRSATPPPVTRSISQFESDPLAVITQLHRQHGDVIAVTLNGTSTVLFGGAAGPPVMFRAERQYFDIYNSDLVNELFGDAIFNLRGDAHQETRQFAESGTARVPARLRHLTELAVSGTVNPMPETVMTGGGDGSAVIVTPTPALPAPVRNWMTIRQAKEHGLIPHTWKNPSGAFGTLKARAKKEGRSVPDVKGMKGAAAMYDAVELADFLERETSTERQAA